MQEQASVRMALARLSASPLLVLACLCGVIVAGVLTGGSISWARSGPVGIATFASVILVVVGVFIHRHWSVSVFLAYILLLFYVDPFVPIFMLKSILYWSDALLIITWLVPCVLGGVFFPSKALWLAATGAWLVLYASVAILTYDINHGMSGLGFMIGWAD